MDGCSLVLVVLERQPGRLTTFRHDLVRFGFLFGLGWVGWMDGLIAGLGALLGWERM